MSDKLAKILNLLTLATILIIECAAMYLQIKLNELPCPLCLLQRIGLWGVAFGFLMNVRYGIRARHYGFALLAATYSGAVATRQILLHIVPGTGQYGFPVFGLSLYVWMFLISLSTIVGIAVLLFFQRTNQTEGETVTPWFTTIGKWLFILIVLAVFADMASTFLECGLTQCPDNPITYKYLTL